MRVQKVTAIADFTDPASPRWAGVEGADIEMVPAPLGLQPTEYVQVSWEERPYGLLEQASVKAVHDGQAIAVQLTWADAQPATGAGEGFPDGAALGFPVRGEPELMQMGSAEAPMQFVQWQASKKQARSVLAKGIGSSLPGAPVSETATGAWSGGRWTVVFTRSLQGEGESANLVPGSDSQIGIAVWNGSNEERAGIKAVSPDWTPLALDP